MSAAMMHGSQGHRLEAFTFDCLVVVGTMRLLAQVGSWSLAGGTRRSFSALRSLLVLEYWRFVSTASGGVSTARQGMTGALRRRRAGRVDRHVGWRSVCQQPGWPVV